MKINDKYINELPDIYKKSYLDYLTGTSNTETWGSHQPLLIHLVNTITDGNVIEMGMGDNSTPLLHLLCEKQGRKLYSYDFEEKWFNKFLNYQNDDHRIFLLNENLFKQEIYKFEFHYSIAFIDSHPAWTRQHSIDILKDKVDYFIIHDSFWNENGKISKLNNYNFNAFKNVLHFTKVKNGSSVFSNKEFPEEITKIFN